MHSSYINSGGHELRNMMPLILSGLFPVSFSVSLVGGDGWFDRQEYWCLAFSPFVFRIIRSCKPLPSASGSPSQAPLPPHLQ